MYVSSITLKWSPVCCFVAKGVYKGKLSFPIDNVLNNEPQSNLHSLNIPDPVYIGDVTKLDFLNSFGLCARFVTDLLSFYHVKWSLEKNTFGGSGWHAGCAECNILP